MSSVVISGDVSGSVTIQAPATAGSTVVNLPSTLGNTGTSAFATTDASGNLGLGVTPVALRSTLAGLQIGTDSLLYTNRSSGGSFVITSNSYEDSGGAIKYIQNGYSTRLDLRSDDGTFVWRKAASGTAGSALTFSTAMTLDASGRLGIATSSPGALLEVAGTAVADPLMFRLSNAADTRYYWDMWRDNTTGSLNFGSATNAAKITRMTIDTSGNLLVAKTASGATTLGFQALSDGSTASTLSGSTNGSTTSHVYSTGAAAYRFYVGMAGTVYATSTSISAISDQTLKTNVRDLETGLTQVMALRPRRFDWINGDASDVAGFVAQEVEEVLPELVTDYIYNIDEEGNNVIKKSLKMGDILPTLVKAIQEQQALITQLQADVAALKGQ